VTQLAAAKPAGHPTWHLLVVAIAAVAVFVGIKIEEHVRAHPRHHRNRAIPRSNGLLFVALCSAGAAGIHAFVCPEHFREFFALGLFFVVAAALQAVWALLVYLRPTDGLLVVGAAGNVVLILVWAVSRTFGVPIGPEVWRPEAISGLDVIATVLEATLVIAVAALLTRRTRPTLVRVPASGSGR
jgi:hypothetical protein